MKRKGRIYYTIEDMHKLAASRGGKCLSAEYVNTNTKLTWQCVEGHVWDSKPANLLSKRDNCWCRVCEKRPILTIKDCQKAAEEHGGKFLSTEYKNRKTKYEWQCKYGHVWKACFGPIKDKKVWCYVCSNYRQVTIESLQETAKRLGGKCLSTKYNGVGAFYDWECSQGHVWNAIAQNVRWGHWCPYCNERQEEKLCREVFEEWFGEPFIKIRPEWLVNPKTNYKLELDGYCETLNIAFEYNGIQHYKPIAFGSSAVGKEDVERFKIQQEKDLVKEKLCKENGTKLIIIKQFERVSKKKKREEVKLILEKEFSNYKRK